MVRIPTAIPESWVRDARRYWRQGLIDRLWQFLLLVVGGLLVVAALSSGVVLAATVAGIIVSLVLADDIRRTVSDIWHRDFWVWKT